jgi:hypothetical protein
VREKFAAIRNLSSNWKFFPQTHAHDHRDCIENVCGEKSETL